MFAEHGIEVFDLGFETGSRKTEENDASVGYSHSKMSSPKSKLAFFPAKESGQVPCAVHDANNFDLFLVVQGSVE